MFRTILTVALFSLACSLTWADDKPIKSGFVPLSYEGPFGDGKYSLFVPKSYTGDKAYPLIVFLHGSGECGVDGVRPTDIGLGPEIKKKAAFPFLVLFPQAQTNTWKADSDDAKRAMAILDEVLKRYKVDDKRIYLTGVSLGGSGTWSLAAAHPRRWAAIVPVCGRSDPSRAEQIKHIPCWCFHGFLDRAVYVSHSRAMIDALKKAGATPRYTEYPLLGHNSWDATYADTKLYDWLLEQKLRDQK